MSTKRDELWLEFTEGNLCGLCGNHGVIDTTGLRSPAGMECGIVRFCICPNGRVFKGTDAVALTVLRHSRFHALSIAGLPLHRPAALASVGQLST